MQHNSMYFLLRGKGQGTAWVDTVEGHPAGPSGGKDTSASAVGASEGCPELRGATQSWGEPPRAEGSRLLPQALQDSSAGTLLRFRPLRTSTEASIGIASEPSFLPFPFHSAPYPSLAWTGQVTPHYTSYKLIFDSEFAAQGSWPRPWLHLHYRV